jgi:formylglycine-generating enzyme required for sulfatase activity
LAEVGWYDLNASQKIQKVGRKAPNGYGIYDMSGNVSEWVWDWFGNYDSENTKGYPMGPTVGYQRVLRGGSWSTSDKESRVSNRYFTTPSHRSGDLGVRVCRTVVEDISE